MKKVISMIVALILMLALFTVPVMAGQEARDSGADGYLSFLNLSEVEVALRLKAEIPAFHYLEEKGVLEYEGERLPHESIIFYDSLDAMLMGLLSGEITAFNVPECTAKYLCATNDQVKQIVSCHPEKAEGFSQSLLSVLSNGYSFMTLEENIELRDQIDQAIAEMKEDGTLDQLIKSHITDVAENGEPEAVAFEQYEGDPIRVAVTGALPPMDYVAADGSFAGFNTAILAEIGKRLERNIELVQVDSLGRALALAQGNVDVVFWTRGLPEMVHDDGLLEMSEEEQEALIEEKRKDYTEEEQAISDSLRESLSPGVYHKRDMPEGTVITAPYYTDLNVLVTLK